MVHTVKIPKCLRELFGRRSTKLEIATIISMLVLSGIVLLSTAGEWTYLAIWKKIFIIFLTLDITGGVVANFTYSTNLYYKHKPKARLRFIFGHIQPVIIALLMGKSYLESILVMAFTMLSGYLVNKLIEHPSQKTIAIALMSVGIMIFLLFANELTVLPKALFTMYMFKVIYGFSVDHFAVRS